MLINRDEDDQEFFSLAVKRIKSPIDILTTPSGVLTLDWLVDKKLRPDIVFVDINLMFADGVRFMTEFRKNKLFI